ncbi:MAG: hypothetical protein JSS36_07345 [Proteobacteria bacterium]|nr:hypothetical protein [Pseudomonadota bacterium]
MSRLRVLALHHRRLAALLLAMALALRVLVPAGFMPGGDGQLAMKICADQGSAITLLVPLKGGDHDKGAAKADAPCAFAALGHGLTGAADPLVLAVALAFILALGFAPARTPRVPAWPHRTPPALGPPHTA